MLLLIGCRPLTPGSLAGTPAAAQRAPADLSYDVIVDRFNDGDSWNNERFDRTDADDFHGGDLAGVGQRADHLVRLGVGTVVLSPIFEMRDAPYQGAGAWPGHWVWDMGAVESRFGGSAAAATLAEQLAAVGLDVQLTAPLARLGPGAPILRDHPTWAAASGPPGSLDLSQPDLREWQHTQLAALIDQLRVSALHIPSPELLDQHYIAALRQTVGEDVRLIAMDSPTAAHSLLGAGRYDEATDTRTSTAIADIFCGDAPVSQLALAWADDHQIADPTTQLHTRLDADDTARIATRCGDSAPGRAALHQALATLMTARGRPHIQWGTEFARAPAPPDPFHPDLGLKWDAPQPLAGTISELSEARQQHPSLLIGHTWVFHLDEPDVIAFARVTADEITVVAINRGDDQVTVHLPEAIHRGASYRDFLEVVGNSGPFLRHRYTEDGGSSRASRLFLFGHSVMVAWLRRPDGYGPLATSLRDTTHAPAPFLITWNPRGECPGVDVPELPDDVRWHVTGGVAQALGAPATGAPLTPLGAGVWTSAPFPVHDDQTFTWGLSATDANGALLWQLPGPHATLLSAEAKSVATCLSPNPQPVP